MDHKAKRNIFFKVFFCLFRKGALAKDEDEKEIADEFAEEDLSQNDVEQKQGQNDPWGGRRRRRRRGGRRWRRVINRGKKIYKKYKIIKGIATLFGKKDEPGLENGNE